MRELLTLLGGAVLGGAAGYFLTRIRLCAAGACHSRASKVFSILAGAVFGAAVARYFAGF